ncbi:tetratricopeptide repeat protein [Campylobacter sp. VBCF_05 NA6]|uniref:SEL1-like repeat protein n=1 Tax=unclassified Campylobacter TaxID=2593542 RepID=UPI0022E9D204|nr:MULTISPECIES: tetratricopeptide repeat protein [unclassified Campylobacter]MDA3058153.1 tetratricopeptide repeat protein [Campylobacter sp. VBCF_04 NA7]MDA3059724.1 tetratricopeptide repeat protein [Campylobacter sp. VBCF_05 NA6]
MKICNRCKIENIDAARFCKHCGSDDLYNPDFEIKEVKRKAEVKKNMRYFFICWLLIGIVIFGNLAYQFYLPLQYEKQCKNGDMAKCELLLENKPNSWKNLSSAQRENKINNIKEKLCENGKNEYCYDVALNFINNYDYDKAEIYAKKVCNYDSNDCENLAKSFLDNRKINIANSLYEINCKTGYDSSCMYLYEYFLDINDLENLEIYGKKLCNLDLAKCNDIARNYKKMGVYKLSIDIYIMACNKNDYKACNYLIDFYDNKEDYYNGKRLAEKSCNGGNIIGCKYLADYYVGGYGVQKDLSKAVQLYTKACEKNEYSACLALSEIFYNQGDYNMAKILDEKACVGGDTIGCSNIAWLYLNGYGVQKDLSKAIQIYKNECYGHFNKDACETLKFYINGISEFDIYYQGCEKNNVDACYNLAIEYKASAEYKEAEFYYKKACNLNPDMDICESIFAEGLK